MFADYFLEQIRKPLSSFHFYNFIKEELVSNGYVELSELSETKKMPKKGFFTRDGYELVAFNIGNINSSMIVIANCNYPCIKIKRSDYEKIFNVGESIQVIEFKDIIKKSWMSRDLKIVGRVFYLNNENEICEKIYDSKCSLGFVNNDKKEMKITLGIGYNKSLKAMVAESLGIEMDSIVDMDLRFVDSQKSMIIKNNFISGSLNGLGNAYSSFHSFLEATPKNRTNIFVVSDIQDNPQFGTNISLLNFVIQQIVGNDSKKLLPFYAKSLLICNEISDAIESNDESENKNTPKLNNGVVIKKITRYLLRQYQLTSFAIKKGVQIQKSNESYNDTIITNFGIPCLIISLPLLGVHSPRQILHINDLLSHKKLMTELYCNEDI